MSRIKYLIPTTIFCLHTVSLTVLIRFDDSSVSGVLVFCLPVYALDIVVAKIRMNKFVVVLTNTDPSTTAPTYKQYRYEQYDGDLAPLQTATVNFAPIGDTFRHVIIQQRFDTNNAICLTEVRVFLRGS